MPNYALLPYENNKRLLAVKTSTLITQDIEIDTLEPIVIPPGTYDGTAKVRLSAAAAAEVDAQYIAQGHSILGVNGTLVSQDNLPALLNNTLTSVSDATLASVSSYQFYGKSALVSASFSNATTIEPQAFQGCTQLETADFPNVVEIFRQAFYACSRLSSINFPRLQTLGGAVGDGRYFDSCGLVGAVSFPNLTTCAGRNAFSSCRGMTSFSAPLLTNLSTYMFNLCISLSSLNIPSVQTIGPAPFDRSPIQNLRLPSFVSANGSANNESFKNPQLQLLDLGENTATLNYAMGNASNLSTIIIRATAIPTLSGSLFTNTPFASGGTGGTIYISKVLYDHLGDGTFLDYKAATNWSVIDAYGTITWAQIEGSQYEIMEEGDNQ